MCIRDSGTSVGMLAEFGEKRVKDTPISEAAIAGAAVGAAITGLRPIVDLTTPVMTQQQTVSTLDTSSLSLLVVAFNWLATNLTPSLGVRQV